MGVRPYRELRGFERIELAAGESREVVFILDADRMGYYEPYNLTWTLERGDIEVMVGANSADLEKRLLHVQ